MKLPVNVTVTVSLPCLRTSMPNACEHVFVGVHVSKKVCCHSRKLQFLAQCL